MATLAPPRASAPIVDFSIAPRETLAIAYFADMVCSDLSKNPPAVWQRKAAEFAPWKHGFSVTSTTPIYDPSASLIAYAYALQSTRGTNGFIVMGADTSMPPVLAYSFCEGFGAIGRKAYYLGSTVFVKEADAATMMLGREATPLRGAYSAAWRHVIANANKARQLLRAQRGEGAPSASPPPTPEEPSALTAADMQALAATSTHCVVWDDVQEPYAQQYYMMSDFNSENHCGPTAALNIALYWRRRGKQNLLPTSAVAPAQVEHNYKELYHLLKCNAWLWDLAPGTVGKHYMQGLPTYFARKGYATAVSSISHWADYKEEIAAWRPVAMVNYLHGGKYKFHWVVGLGWQESGGSAFIKVNTGWDRRNSTYIYKGSPSSRLKFADFGVKMIVT